MTNINAGIIGLGTYLPEQLLTNQMLAERFAVTPEWIFERSGIRQRHIAAPDQACSDMAIAAARQALENTGTAPDEIGMVLVATSTGDYITPATAPIVQGALDIPEALCADLSAACSGFVYGLILGCNAIKSGFCKKVLLICSEVISRVTNPDDCDTAILFGDGAAAVVLGEVPPGFGLLATDTGSYGTEHQAILIPAGGSRNPASAETVQARQHYTRMDGNQVFMFAMRALGDSAMRALKRGAVSLEEISLVVPHQANRRIIEAAARRMGIPMEKMAVNLETVGNTSSASIPLALHDALSQGKINHGDHLVLTGFGGGVSWGSALIRWHSVKSEIS